MDTMAGTLSEADVDKAVLKVVYGGLDLDDSLFRPEDNHPELPPSEVVGICNVALDGLEAAFELIRYKSGWTVRTAARMFGVNGPGCDPKHPQAVCFCSVGALARVSEQHEYYIASRSLSACAWVVSNGESMHMMTYNDAHKHGEVIVVWQETIRSLKRIRAKHEALAAAKEVQP